MFSHDSRWHRLIYEALYALTPLYALFQLLLYIRSDKPVETSMVDVTGFVGYCYMFKLRASVQSVLLYISFHYLGGGMGLANFQKFEFKLADLEPFLGQNYLNFFKYILLRYVSKKLLHVHGNGFTLRLKMGDLHLFSDWLIYIFHVTCKE